VIAILDAAEAVRVRLVLISVVSGEQRAAAIAARRRAAGTGYALRDPRLDGGLSRLALALVLMGKAFANPGPELNRWCENVLGLAPRRAWRAISRWSPRHSTSAARRCRAQPMIRRCSTVCADRGSIAPASSGSSARRCAAVKARRTRGGGR